MLDFYQSKMLILNLNHFPGPRFSFLSAYTLFPATFILTSTQQSTFTMANPLYHFRFGVQPDIGDSLHKPRLQYAALSSKLQTLLSTLMYTVSTYIMLTTVLAFIIVQTGEMISFLLEPINMFFFRWERIGLAFLDWVEWGMTWAWVIWAVNLIVESAWEEMLEEELEMLEEGLEREEGEW
jgi:hypothetical protein